MKRKRTDKSFMVPVHEIEEKNFNLSMNQYQEVVYEEVKYAPPMQIIAEIEALDKERQQMPSDNLKSMLG